MVGADNVEGLRVVLSRHHFDEWYRWQDQGGKNLLEAADSGLDRNCCAEYLRMRLLRERGARQPSAGAIERAPAAVPSPPQVGTYVPGRARPPTTVTYVERRVPSREPTGTYVPGRAQPPTATEPIGTFVPGRAQEPTIPCEPLVPAPPAPEPAVPAPTPQVVQPNVVDVGVEIVDRQDHPVILEVPVRQSHTVTREVPRVGIVETTETATVPVKHREEVLDVTTYPEVTHREVPQITVHQKARVEATREQRQEERFVHEPQPPPTVERPRVVIRPDPRIIPVEVLTPQDVQHSVETREYDVEHAVRREQLVLRPEVSTETTPIAIPAREERIVEVPETRVETRVFEAPEVTTVKTVHHFPTYPARTNFREPLSFEQSEPLSFEQVDTNRDGVISREEFRSFLERSTRSAYDHDGAGGESLAAEVQRLRSENQRLEQDGRLMHQELSRRNAEGIQLVEELAREKRRNHELDLRLHAAQQARGSGRYVADPLPPTHPASPAPYVTESHVGPRYEAGDYERYGTAPLPTSYTTYPHVTERYVRSGNEAGDYARYLAGPVSSYAAYPHATERSGTRSTLPMSSSAASSRVTPGAARGSERDVADPLPPSHPTRQPAADRYVGPESDARGHEPGEAATLPAAEEAPPTSGERAEAATPPPDKSRAEAPAAEALAAEIAGAGDERVRLAHAALMSHTSEQEEEPRDSGAAVAAGAALAEGGSLTERLEDEARNIVTGSEPRRSVPDRVRDIEGGPEAGADEYGDESFGDESVDEDEDVHESVHSAGSGSGDEA